MSELLETYDVDSDWLCPICRKVCCCAVQSCSKAHRHCKAYRYRLRRAELAADSARVDAILAAGAARARLKAGEVLARARRACGLDRSAAPIVVTPGRQP